MLEAACGHWPNDRPQHTPALRCSAGVHAHALMREGPSFASECAIVHAPLPAILHGVALGAT
jgi:hypothetical protein